MAVDLRRQIFELRQAGTSERGIAKQLGLSSSKVHRELAKRAPEVRAERAEQQPFEDGFTPMVDFGLPPPPSGQAVDPILLEERTMMEREQLQLRRVQLRTQRLEAERRAQLLEHPDAAGGGNGLVAVILQALDRQREDTRSLLQQLVTRQAAPPPAPAPPSLSEQLSQWRALSDTVQSFAPAKAPSSASDLEFVVAKERLQLESQDIVARREAELAAKREEAQSQVRRNDAVATAIEQFAPVAAKAFELWFEERNQKEQPPALPPANGDQPAPRPVLVQPEIEGQCPSCQVPLALAGGQDEQCPKCGSTLAAVEGRIRVRMPNGSLWPPPSGAEN